MEKKIRVMRIKDTCSCMNLYMELLADEEVHKARCSSSRSIKKADEKIDLYSRRLVEEDTRLGQYKEEEKEAKKLATLPSAKIYFMYQPLDQDGRAMGNPIYTKVNTIADGMEMLKKEWEILRGFGDDYSIVVRDDGVIEECERLESEIATLQQKLKTLRTQLGE